MYWTLDLASYLADAPWENGITKAELIDWAEMHGASAAVLENLQELDDEEIFYGMEDIWPDIPTSDGDYGWTDDEY